MTHNAKVLALLSDGEPHSHRELYGLYVIAHSRISDLRKRGHNIISWREGDSYFYRLLSDSRATLSAPAIAEQALPGGTARPSPRLTADSLAESDAADAHPSVSSGQLVLGTA